MSGRRKKLSQKMKIYNIILIVALIVLMLLLSILLIVQVLGSSGAYKIESRSKNIEMSKKKDGNDFKTIGWIRVQGTNIDYPLYGVVSVTYDYPVTDSYLWSLNLDSDFHDMMIVYGHNVMNLGPKPKAHDDQFTRMEELMNYVYVDFVKQNQFIQMSIDDHDYLYKIMAVNFMRAKDLDLYPLGDWPTDKKAEYLERIQKESIYDFDDSEFNIENKYLSVVTCSRFFMDGKSYDFIVTGRLLKDGEKAQLTGVRRNKNYVQISDIMEGVDEDDESFNNA